ncbi:MAG: hypothetical protein E7562_07990 [Ruminococcaceae bacterium]|nr:hypothetical protein [Oscillospiraceae bacterium]
MITNRRLRFILLASMLLTVFIFIYQLTKPVKATTTNDIPYKMTIKENQVVLYKGDSFITVYANIVPQNLPYDDQKELQNGIFFKSRTEADRAAEDYDG